MVLHVLADEERLERQRLADRPDQAKLLLAGEHEAAERGDLGLLHRLQQQHVRAARGLGACRDEEVGAVEVGRIDLLEPDEPADLDRARRVVLLDRLEVCVLDLDELSLRDLPALDELVGLDHPLVHRAVPLLLDRCAAVKIRMADMLEYFADAAASRDG